MNLLVVDDDFHVIQSIQKNLHWESLYIDHVFSALGSAAAKEILEKYMVDIIICDIEMPQETGLELIKWVRVQGMSAQVIFLTSYAKFEYAQKAISLDSLEYILKPVDYQLLEQTLSQAVLKAKENHTKMAEKFWMALVSGDFSMEDMVSENMGEKVRRFYVNETIFLPVVFQSEKKLKDELDWLTDQVIKLCALHFQSELGSIKADYEFGGPLSEYSYLVLLKAKMNTDHLFLDRQLKAFLKDLTATLQKEKKEMFVGVGTWSIAGLIFNEIQEINQMMYDSPRVNNKILYLEDRENMQLSDYQPDLKVWAQYLKEDEMHLLAKSVEDYLNKLELQKQLSSRILRQLGMDITQMIYSYLDSMNIYIHVIFHNEENKCLYENAFFSKANMVKYVNFLLEKCKACKQEIEKNQDVADIIQTYLDNHFQENISREELSRHVFLNPDYLSRLFKKKTGISISGYLMTKRMNLAKEMLVTTKIPVSVISSQVGYDNFAYFTKIFRERTGMSPNEYRKSHEKTG